MKYSELPIFIVFIMITPATSATNLKKVGIIGAGAAGLVCAKILKDESNFDVIIFEKNDFIGGTWQYIPEKSVMYKSLRTNLPKEIMGFSNQDPFSASETSFIGHKEVLNYLENYSQKYQLEDCMQLSTEVININEDESGWQVSTYCTKSNLKATCKVDYLIICNGHYNKPYIPEVKGIQYFKGKQQIHSFSYDDPKIYSNMRTLIIGGKSSATDLAREISSYATEVHIIDRNYDKITDEVKGNISLHPSLSHVDDHGNFICENDSIIGNIDTVIWCTGFLYDFPFLYNIPHLQQSCGPTRQVKGLYKALFPHQYSNTMAFMGLPYAVVPFPLFQFQAQWIAALLSKRTTLPSYQERVDLTAKYENKLIENRQHESRYHYLGMEQFNYMRDLAQEAGVDSPDTIEFITMLEEIYEDVSKNRPSYVGADDAYRERKYTVDRMNFDWKVSP